MISKCVGVNVFGKLSKHLYSGYVQDGTGQNRSVLILTRKTPYDFFHGIVIAVAVLENDKQSKLIVSPPGEVFYEPEIRELLSSRRELRVATLKCLYEKSCGAVVFCRFPYDGIKILLVKNHNGRHWSFPKGHIESGEDEYATALREIKEETNLDVKIIGNFREETDYCPFGKIRKRVVFFLAESKTCEVKIQESEIDAFLWATPAQAHRLCTFSNDHRLIDKAVSFISSLS